MKFCRKHELYDIRYVYPGDDDEDEETNEISDNLSHALRHPGFLPAPPPPTTKAPSPKQRFDFDRKYDALYTSFFPPLIE